MTASASLRLFGGFSLCVGNGEPVKLSLRKSEALIAYLALSPSQRCSRDRLATLMWGESTPSCGRQSLRQTRLILERDLAACGLPILAFDRREIWLEGIDLSIDAVEFGRLIEAGDEDSLARAAELYCGEFLAGCDVASEEFEEWLRSSRAWYREQTEAALCRLLALQEQANALDAALRTAKKILALDPLREDIHRWLMRSFAAKGQRGSALAAYEACCAVLRRELDVDPEEETSGLYEAIASGNWPGDRREGTRPTASPGAPILLPRESAGDPPPTHTVPQSHSQIVSAVRELSAAALQVVQVAAVADGRYAMPVLAFVTELRPEKIAEALSELQRAGLLQTGDGELRTIPQQLRPEILRQILVSHRRHLHYAVAVALEELAGNSLSDGCYDIAAHYREAGNLAKAVPHELRFGELEIDRGNFDLAKTLFTAAASDINGLPAGEERSRLKAETHILLADLAELSQDLDESERLLDLALPIARRHNDSRLLTSALLAKSRLYARRGRSHQAFGCIRLAVRRSADRSLDRCWLLAERFADLTNLITGEVFQSGNALALAQERIQAAGRHSTEADVAALQALFHASRQKFAPAYAACAQSIRIAEKLPDTTSLTVALQTLGTIQTWDGEAAAALEAFDRAQQLAGARGDLLRQYTSQGFRGFGLLNAGRPTEAVAELSAAVELGKSLKLRFMMAMFVAWLSEALMAAGDAERALDTSRTAVRLSTEWNQPWPRSVASRVLAHAVTATSSNERDLAGRIIRSALETQKSLGLPLETARSLTMQALIANTLH